jgi:hypothetical protein
VNTQRLSVQQSKNRFDVFGTAMIAFFCVLDVIHVVVCKGGSNDGPEQYKGDKGTSGNKGDPEQGKAAKENTSSIENLGYTCRTPTFVERVKL